MNLHDKLQHLPESPGVYFFYNQEKKVIYVGKAKNLKSRVRSYFNKHDDGRAFSSYLFNEIHSLDVILVNNEKEALVHERTLIKHHKPKYNINLKDDKEYPFLRVQFAEKWPRIEKVRYRKNDKATYIGPFTKATDIPTLLKLVHKVFPIVRCSRYEFLRTKKTCQYYHIKKCLGPCVLPVDNGFYHQIVQNAVSFLNGNRKTVVHDLKKRMEAESFKENYEQAIFYRDQLQALERLIQTKSSEIKDTDSLDVIGMHCDEGLLAFYTMVLKEGVVSHHEEFVMPRPAESLEESFASFLLQFYQLRPPPETMVTPIDFKPSSDFLSVLGNEKLSVLFPKRGPKLALLETAQKNAKYALAEHQLQRKKNQNINQSLMDFLNLDSPPKTIECFDISNMQADATVASNVRFQDGVPDKKSYRIYHIKTIEDRPNDYDSLREVMQRRMTRGLQEKNLPDLFLIDGGKGQLNACLEIVNQFKEAQVKVISIAKARSQYKRDDSKTQSHERIFVRADADPLVLDPHDIPFRVLTHLRDEAHRFALKHHRKLMLKKSKFASLDQVKGIGEKTKIKLLDHFSDFAAIKTASLEDLRKAGALSEKTAQALKEWLTSVKT